MPVRRLARTMLSLLIAYAVVLGGVLAPVLGHAANPPGQLCAYGAGTLTANPSPDAPQPRGMPDDCCPALCSGQAAIMPPGDGIGRTAIHTSTVLYPFTTHVREAAAVRDPSARAPPLG